ncbi:MAG TPA: multicopper oxidase family protein [Gemmatimonadaceae bacterium]|nr:multicopper oxidase family protein [Gemmatimonadaceae bacterium]
MARALSLPALAAWIVVATLAAPPLGSTSAYPRLAQEVFVNPAVLSNSSRAPHTVEVTLTAAKSRVSLTPGKTSDVYTYNGMSPGPTIELREGDRVIIHFKNELSEETTIHWHGLHIPADQDGSPIYPIQPGKSHDYVFTVEHGTAGTYWYHPHPDMTTGHQVAKGLYGALVIRSDDDPLPGSLPEKIIVLADNRFAPDGSIDIPERASLAGLIDENNGREGNTIFLSGHVMPTIEIRSGEVQRWRIINASASRVYRLSLGGQTFTQVGTDGGLFAHPADMKEITLSNSERVEILVHGTGAPGSTTVLRSLPYDRYAPQTRPKDWDKAVDIAALRYSDEPPVTSMKIPAALRVIPVLDTLKATNTRVFALGQGIINGKTMDMKRVDERVRLGVTEIWQVENIVGMDHPFHLHGFRFQVLDRNGVPEKDRRWKDTINVPKHETVRFIVKFDDFPGKWMYHCHILDHEDHGMMGILEVK